MGYYILPTRMTARRQQCCVDWDLCLVTYPICSVYNSLLCNNDVLTGSAVISFHLAIIRHQQTRYLCVELGDALPLALNSTPINS